MLFCACNTSYCTSHTQAMHKPSTIDPQSTRVYSKIRLIEEVARSLEWAPSLKHLANLVIDSLSSNGKGSFNALHLRVEKDAEVWADIMGGKDVWWAGEGLLCVIGWFCVLILAREEEGHNMQCMCTHHAGGMECICGGNVKGQV